MGGALLGNAAWKPSPRNAAKVAATCACLTGGVLLRSPSGAVSGPITPNQMEAESAISLPCFCQATGAEPRPWSTVMKNVVAPRYSGIDCTVSHNSRRKRSK